MDISGYSEYGKEKLMSYYNMISYLPAEELAMRIAVALDEQDSCKGCWIATMRGTLIEGKCAMWTCDKCTEEMKKEL